MQIVNNIVMKKLNEIKPYIRNARKNDKTVELLVELIPKVGFNVPIVIDHAGVIVKGHSRFKAAIKLGMEEVPCVITDADEEAIKLDRIADNRVSEFSEWINEPLMHELDMLTVDFSMLDFKVAKPTQFATDYRSPVIPQYSQEPTQPYIPSIPNTSYEQESNTASTGGYPTPTPDYSREEAYETPSPTPAYEAPPIMVSESDLERAYQQQQQVVTPPPKYFKLVCECCGHIQFVREQDVWESIQ